MNQNPSHQKNEEKKNPLQVHQIEVDTNFKLSFTSGIRSILEDSHGNIWFGTHQEGLCKYTPSKEENAGGTVSYYTIENGLTDNQVRSIFEDADGRIWFECAYGLNSYEDEKLVSYHANSLLPKSYLFKYIWPAESGQAGQNDLWFKGNEGINYNIQEGAPGVYRWDGTQLTYHVFPLNAPRDQHNAYSVSTPFCRGKSGRLWFGTYAAAIGYDGTSFTIIDDQSLGFNEETGYCHVRSIYEDSKGSVWIGNNGIGVLLYDGTRTINFSESQGLIPETSLRRGGYRSDPGSLEHVFAIGRTMKGIFGLAIGIQAPGSMMGLA